MGATREKRRVQLVTEKTSCLWSVNKAVQTENKAGIWSWDITDWLAPQCGSVRAAEQDSGYRMTLGAGWVSLVVCVSAVNLSETCRSYALICCSFL